MEPTFRKADFSSWLPALSQKTKASLPVVTYLRYYACYRQRIVATLENLPVTIKETVMSTLDIFVEKGKKIGREEGRAEEKKKNAEKVVRNLIRVSALSDEQIASVAEVPVEYVTRMRSDILERTGFRPVIRLYFYRQSVCWSMICH